MTNIPQPEVSESDPRVQMAAERTLLAWIRTGLAMMAFGFVVARFAVFLQTLGQDVAHLQPELATWIGIGLVALGILTNIAAAMQHLRYWRRIGVNRKSRWSTWGFAVFTALAMAVAGLAIAIYLIVVDTEFLGNL